MAVAATRVTSQCPAVVVRIVVVGVDAKAPEYEVLYLVMMPWLGFDDVSTPELSVSLQEWGYSVYRG